MPIDDIYGYDRKDRSVYVREYAAKLMVKFPKLSKFEAMRIAERKVGY